MTESTANAAPAPAPVPAPAPPAAPGEHQPEPAPGNDVAGNLARAEAALAAERKARQAAEARASKVEQQHMSDQERAVAQARGEGRTEALREAATQMAAAEFRAAAAGKLADPSGALEFADLGKFVSEDGSIDRRAITAAVDKLAASLGPVAQPAGAKVPPGPRQPDAQPDDFIRSVAAGALKGRV